MNFFLSKEIKRSFYFTLPIFVIMGFMEILGLAILFPLFSILFKKDEIIEKVDFLNTDFFLNIITFLNENSKFFLVIILIYFLFRFVVIYFSQKKLAFFKTKVFYIISNKLLKNYLNLNYVNFVKLNSSIIRRQIAEVHNYSEYLFNLLVIISETIILVFIVTFLLFFDFYNVLRLILFLIFLSLPIIIFFKKFQKKLSIERVNSANNYFKVLDESVSNFIYLKISNKVSTFLENFSFFTKSYTSTSAKSHIISVLPKPFFETIFIIILLFFMFSIRNLESKSYSIIIFSTLIYGFSLYRISPSLIKIFSSFSAISYLKNSKKLLEEDLILKKEELVKDHILFNKNIKFQNISFNYDDKKILNKFSYSFEKGKKYLIYGESGKGKSTLLYILMGLIKPSDGQIILDGRNFQPWNHLGWRNNVSYIPQKPMFLDTDLKHNIAFKDKIDDFKINEIIESLNLTKLLDLFVSDKKKTIGDGANQISGGQAQRISIARALYRNSEILVMDEPTSNLDNENEKKIMDLIFFDLFKTKTIIFTSHNSDNLKYADDIIKL